MTLFLQKAFIATSFSIFALSLVSCSKTYASLPKNLVVLATTSTAENHTRYIVITRYGAQQLKTMPITDHRMKFAYYVSKRGQLIDGHERDLGRAPCRLNGVMNSTNESYALSNDGRMIYCIYGRGGGPGPLKSMEIGDLASERTSSEQFDDNGPGSIVFLSKTKIALLLLDSSCITKSPGGFADRLVIFNPEIDRIVRYLRCSDAVVRYRNGLALVRRISETGDKWRYSLDGKTWHNGIFVGNTRAGASLYIDSSLGLRINSQPGRILARNVYRAEAFDSGGIAKLTPLYRRERR